MRQQSADTRLRQPVVQLFVPAKRAEQTNEKKERAMDTFALDLNRHPYSLRVAAFAKESCKEKGQARDDVETSSVARDGRWFWGRRRGNVWVTGDVVGGSVCVRVPGVRARLRVWC